MLELSQKLDNGNTFKLELVLTLISNSQFFYSLRHELYSNVNSMENEIWHLFLQIILNFLKYEIRFIDSINNSHVNDTSAHASINLKIFLGLLPGKISKNRL